MDDDTSLDKAILQIQEISTRLSLYLKTELILRESISEKLYSQIVVGAIASFKANAFVDLEKETDEDIPSFLKREKMLFINVVKDLKEEQGEKK